MCPVSCERVVYPAGCLEAKCPRAYSYEQHGRMVFGCIEKVYAVEIDVEAFAALQRQPGGFGALRVLRDPLAVCRSDVDRTFAHRGGACINPAFFEEADEQQSKGPIVSLD
jgi:hypothetical protein